jgi:hypothetical protein
MLQFPRVLHAGLGPAAGHPLRLVRGNRRDSPLARGALGFKTGTLVATPVPAAHECREVAEKAIAQALKEADARRRVRGKKSPRSCWRA